MKNLILFPGSRWWFFGRRKIWIYHHQAHKFRLFSGFRVTDLFTFFHGQISTFSLLVSKFPPVCLSLGRHNVNRKRKEKASSVQTKAAKTTKLWSRDDLHFNIKEEINFVMVRSSLSKLFGFYTFYVLRVKETFRRTEKKRGVHSSQWLLLRNRVHENWFLVILLLYLVTSSRRVFGVSLQQ